MIAFLWGCKSLCSLIASWITPCSREKIHTGVLHWLHLCCWKSRDNLIKYVSLVVLPSWLARATAGRYAIFCRNVTVNQQLQYVRIFYGKHVAKAWAWATWHSLSLRSINSIRHIKVTENLFIRVMAQCFYNAARNSSRTGTILLAFLWKWHQKNMFRPKYEAVTVIACICALSSAACTLYTCTAHAHYIGEASQKYLIRIKCYNRRYAKSEVRFTTHLPFTKPRWQTSG